MEFPSSLLGGPAALCFPLLKFSYATVSGEYVAPIPWVHISSNNDLFVTFDMIDHPAYNGASTKRQKLRVLQDPTVMEDIDVEILATEARKAAVQAQGSISSRPNPYVTIIARDPCIAMRYPISNGQVRRFQVRFAQQADYYQVMGILTKAGVPVSEATVKPAQTAPVLLQQQMPSLHQTVNKSNVEGRMHQPTHQNTPGITHQTPPQVQFGPATSTFSMHNMTSSQPQPMQASEIDVYIPRPSTAPESFASNLSDCMPPRRTLPFPRTISKIDGERDMGKPEQPSVGEDHKTGKEKEVEQVKSTKMPVTAQTNKKTTAKKRAASKPKKAPMAKRAKPAVEVQSLTPAVVKQQNVASLKEADIPVNLTESVPSVVVSQPTIDTQALMTMAENKLLAYNRKADLTRSPPKASTDVCGEPMRVEDKGSKSQDPPSNNISSVQFEMNLNRESLQGNEASVLPVHDRVLRSKKTAPENFNPACKPLLQSVTKIHELADIERLTRTVNEPTVMDKVLPITQSQEHDTRIINNIEDSIFSFLSDKAANIATTKLAQFADMSKQDQHQALESFICRTIDDDHFITLCKSLDGVWQKVLCLK